MESAYLRIPRKKKRDPRDRRLGSRGSLLFYSKLRGTNQSVVFDLALVNVSVAVNQDTEDIILNVDFGVASGKVTRTVFRGAAGQHYKGEESEGLQGFHSRGIFLSDTRQPLFCYYVPPQDACKKVRAARIKFASDSRRWADFAFHASAKS